MMRKVYKYATGQPIPEGAIYVSTITQTMMEIENNGTIPCFCHKDPRCSDAPKTGWANCWLVWHYFLVEVDDEKEVKPAPTKCQECGGEPDREWFGMGFCEECWEKPPTDKTFPTES